MEIKLSKATEADFSLEELAMEYDDRIDCDGEVIRYGTVNNAKLRKKIEYMYAKGREAMKRFTRWQEERYGDKASTCEQRSLIVWRTLIENPSDPVARLLDKEAYNYAQRLRIRKSLSYFATWMMEEGERPEDIDFAKALVTRLAAVPARKRLRDTKRATRPIIHAPYTQEEINKLLSALETFVERHGGRYPWARAILRFQIITGHITNSDIFYLEREKVEEAVYKYEQGQPAVLSVWGKRPKARLIPINLAYDEIKVIADWGFPWGIIGDIVSPNTKNTPLSAQLRARNVLKKVFAIAEIPWHEQSTRRIRRAAVRRVWDTTQDFMILSTMFGLHVQQAKDKDWLNIPVAVFDK